METISNVVFLIPSWSTKLDAATHSVCFSLETWNWYNIPQDRSPIIIIHRTNLFEVGYGLGMLVLRYGNKDAERREREEKKGKGLATEVIGKYQQNKVHIQKGERRSTCKRNAESYFGKHSYHHLEVVWGRWE